MPPDDCPTVERPADPEDTPASASALRPRFAGASDVDELVRLRAVMFESLGVDTTPSGWRDRCRVHLHKRIGDGTLIGAVVDRPDTTGLVASVLAELSTKMPAPSRSTGSSAYLLSVSTDPQWRRRGLSRASVSFLLDELRRRQVRRVDLHATPDGEQLYRSLGFLPRAGGKPMRLVL